MNASRRDVGARVKASRRDVRARVKASWAPKARASRASKRTPPRPRPRRCPLQCPLQLRRAAHEERELAAGRRRQVRALSRRLRAAELATCEAEWVREVQARARSWVTPETLDERIRLAIANPVPVEEGPRLEAMRLTAPRMTLAEELAASDASQLRDSDVERSALPKTEPWKLTWAET